METCPSCGEEFIQISTHWSLSSTCDYPELSTEQEEIITGLVMGDGSINRGEENHNPCLQVEMTNKEFLDETSEKLGWLSNGVKHRFTAEENKARAEEHFGEGSVNSAKESWRLDTKRHPELSKFSSWYTSGDKIWDVDELTPTILKYLYVSDGTYNNTHNYISICTVNEIENKQEFEELFEELGFPVMRWDYDRAVFSVETSEQMLEYMGKPLSGFEYKWNNDAK